MSNSEEEEIARNYVCFGMPDVTILVLDATCLERNLNLVYQTMEITKNIVICVNLLDEAKRKGIDVNIKELEKNLGVPVVGTIARKKNTLLNLMQKVDEVCSKRTSYIPNLNKYSNVIEENITILSQKIKKFLPEKYHYLIRWICIKLFDNDEKIISSINENMFGYDIREKKSIRETLNDCSKTLKDCDISGNNFKYNITTSILKKCEITSKEVCTYKTKKYHIRDRKIDKVITSKIWGIPIMLCFLGLIFWLTIIGANYPSTLLSNFFGYLEEKIVFLFNLCSSPSWLTSLCVDGLYKTLTRGY